MPKRKQAARGPHSRKLTKPRTRGPPSPQQDKTSSRASCSRQQDATPAKGALSARLRLSTFGTATVQELGGKWHQTDPDDLWTWEMCLCGTINAVEKWQRFGSILSVLRRPGRLSAGQQQRLKAALGEFCAHKSVDKVRDVMLLFLWLNEIMEDEDDPNAATLADTEHVMDEDLGDVISKLERQLYPQNAESGPSSQANTAPSAPTTSGVAETPTTTEPSEGTATEDDYITNDKIDALKQHVKVFQDTGDLHKGIPPHVFISSEKREQLSEVFRFFTQHCRVNDRQALEHLYWDLDLVLNPHQAESTGKDGMREPYLTAQRYASTGDETESESGARTEDCTSAFVEHNGVKYYRVKKEDFAPKEVKQVQEENEKRLRRMVKKDSALKDRIERPLNKFAESLAGDCLGPMLARPSNTPDPVVDRAIRVSNFVARDNVRRKAAGKNLPVGEMPRLRIPNAERLWYNKRPGRTKTKTAKPAKKIIAGMGSRSKAPVTKSPPESETEAAHRQDSTTQSVTTDSAIQQPSAETSKGKGKAKA